MRQYKLQLGSIYMDRVKFKLLADIHIIHYVVTVMKEILMLVIVKNNQLIWFCYNHSINLMDAFVTHISCNQLKRKQTEKQRREKQEDWFYISYCLGLWMQTFFDDVNWLRFFNEDDVVPVDEALNETKKLYYNNGADILKVNQVLDTLQ